jgi:DNA-binding XRE family transcriptional regulator
LLAFLYPNSIFNKSVAFEVRQLQIKKWNNPKIPKVFVCNVVSMLCSIYTMFMSRNEEAPVYNRIAQQRERIGMSRQQLAEMVNVHYQTIGYLERGEYSPSLALALRISEALNIDVQSLFSIKPFPKGKRNE